MKYTLYGLLLISSIGYTAPFCFDSHGNTTTNMNQCYDTVNKRVRREDNARREALQNNIDVVREAGYWEALAAKNGNPGPNTTMISNDSASDSDSDSYSNADSRSRAENSNSNSNYNNNDNYNSNSNQNYNDNDNYNSNYNHNHNRNRWRR